MLVLARYPQETIVIGEVHITVLAIRAHPRGRARVTLGIEAPPEIPILRAELSRSQLDKRSNVPTTTIPATTTTQK